MFGNNFWNGLLFWSIYLLVSLALIVDFPGTTISDQLSFQSIIKILWIQVSYICAGIALPYFYGYILSRAKARAPRPVSNPTTAQWPDQESLVQSLGATFLIYGIIIVSSTLVSTINSDENLLPALETLRIIKSYWLPTLIYFAISFASLTANTISYLSQTTPEVNSPPSSVSGIAFSIIHALNILHAIDLRVFPPTSGSFASFISIIFYFLPPVLLLGVLFHLNYRTNSSPTGEKQRGSYFEIIIPPTGLLASVAVVWSFIIIRFDSNYANAAELIEQAGSYFLGILVLSSVALLLFSVGHRLFKN